MALVVKVPVVKRYAISRHTGNRPEGHGGQFDHELAMLAVGLRGAGIKRVFLCPPNLSLDLPKGSRVVVSMGRCGCGPTGLVWPDALAFDPAVRIGTSNAATGRCI
jgi:hypothetical protein